jgi:TonB family protein
MTYFKKFIFALILSPLTALASWNYETFKMGIDEIPTYYGSTRSLNSLSLGFPYQGKNFGTLAFRHRADGDFSIMLSIQKGQLLCGFDSCQLKLRIDGQPSFSYGFHSPDNGVGSILFADEPTELEEKLRKAKRFKIEINVFHESAKVLEFDVSGLNYTKLKRNPESAANKTGQQEIEGKAGVDEDVESIESRPTDEQQKNITSDEKANRVLATALPSNEPPVYPMMSKRLGEQGDVVLRIEVMSDGSVGNSEVKSSSGYLRLDQAAIDRSKFWRFNPETVNGKPVNAWYMFTIPFKLKESSSSMRSFLKLFSGTP